MNSARTRPCALAVSTEPATATPSACPTWRLAEAMPDARPAWLDGIPATAATLIWLLIMPIPMPNSPNVARRWALADVPVNRDIRYVLSISIRPPNTSGTRALPVLAVIQAASDGQKAMAAAVGSISRPAAITVAPCTTCR
jgi:hypothetical protein